MHNHQPERQPLERRNRERAERIHLGLVIVLQALMTIELTVLLYQRQWITAFLVFAIMAIMLSPPIIGRRFRITIPSEFQILAILFVFASLFLGEIRSYYTRLWWWDIALHTSSGLLLGILGFLLVYVLNESDRVAMHMRPRFVALFAFLFAVTTGVLWEIFEFSMDQLLGTNMQKPMLGDPSGLTDTMWDLIVDTLGALIISIFGWWYMNRRERSFIESWIRKFIEHNPRLFKEER